ncbi:hemin uptake protein HemP, partial [Mesorhizobium sp. M00.F.Ca.ET.217.01.1.1]
MNTHNANDFRYRVRRSEDVATRFDSVPLAVRTLPS